MGRSSLSPEWALVGDNGRQTLYEAPAECLYQVGCSRVLYLTYTTGPLFPGVCAQNRFRDVVGGVLMSDIDLKNCNVPI